MGLFDFLKKKECDICGGEIGLLGNRKLEDGNLCKDCAARLSPWFDDRRHSTIAQIKEQLEYREANREKVARFHMTRTLGKRMRVLLDEDAGLFLVTDAKDLAEANPDVIPLSDVTGCELDIDETRTEQTRTNEEGKSESYNPPRYTYSYNFNMVIHVRHPWFDEIRFRLNGWAVTIQSHEQGVGRMLGFGRAFNPELDNEYREYRQLGEEIKAALMDARRQVRDQAAAAAAPRAAVTCPYCGATTTPDAKGCCEYCGGAVGQ
ncbi:MAG: DUF4428 domain-containing protein [Clostridia bacterium]|nr:DUF4428 domain-containing protein [Clostridia bacterium]